MKNKRILMNLSVAATVLFIPLIAMQFTDQVNWSAVDFLVMGILLFGAVIGCEFILRRVTRRKSRIILCLVVTGLFVLVWMELAVGIFGTPLAGS